MKRRDFLRTSALVSAGVVGMPYILPTGRLFAATGSRMANHVVFCLYAGGVRNLESVHKAEGNLMPNTLNGSESISTDILPAMTSLPSLSQQPLQNFGTLYKEFRFAEGPTGHFSGHSTALTGRYNLNGLSISQRPQYPTIFELYRKHSAPSKAAMNAWWVSNSLGPYPGLNYSDYPGYGALYGANYVQPASMLNGMPPAGYNFSATDQLNYANARSFFDKNFSANVTAGDAGIVNTATERITIEAFLRDQYNQAVSGGFNNIWGLQSNAINNDILTLYFAEQVMQEFKPELLVVNMQDIDVAHNSYSAYCNNIRKADFAVAKLWETIQNTPGMANETVLIVAPEHGRNLQPNTIRDQYGRYALDHTNDNTSRELFCLIAGPSGVVQQGQTVSQITGESIDIAPTIARVLGFDTELPSGMLPGRHLNEAFN